MTPPMQSDPITELREALTKAREASFDLGTVEVAGPLQEQTSMRVHEDAAWSAVSAAIEEVEGERKRLRGALAEIRAVVNFEFGEMKREREIMDPLAHSGDIARRALNPEKTNAE